MKKIVFGFLAFSSIAFGQIAKNPGDFHKVTSFDQIDVILVAGNENIVHIDGNNADDVELINKNGELKIRMKLLKLLDGDHISVTVYYKEIDAVEANEGSRISCNDKIESTLFHIIAKEGSEVKLLLNVEKLNVLTSNGSTVYISGTAKFQDVLVHSGANYQAESLETQQTEIVCNAGGNTHIFATQLVEAKVRAGGNITIHGNPKQINQKVVAGGTIREAK